ncbi:hypothetical protein EOD43_15775 [Sphingomonas crocodyli]|uniref:Uncharacterized protein n=1 Tax=Sphingomonas crocodyli TaxID=1979270 RepID=A0A437LZZ5_9SPHN|nr:hypothetical protein EOD43_15775 [Sphingomonas crocodyli]
MAESLLAAKGLASAAEIEAFVPSAEDEAAWQAERDRYIQAVFAPFARAIPLDRRPLPDSFLRR